LTAYTVTDTKAFRALLVEARQQDYALASEEHELGVHAVAVPLRNAEGATVAALNVVVPESRVRSGAVQRELLPLLQGASLELRALL
jgi:IclR family pca regulon transcriptional regulator